MQKRGITAFGPLLTAVDPADIPDNAAADMLNVRRDDLSIKVRYGYRNLQAAQASFTASYGCGYYIGFNSSNAEIEEYVSFEHLGAAVRPYARSATDGAVSSVITNGGSSLSLNASTWKGFSWLSSAYFYNPNNTPAIYRHTIGTANSFTPIQTPTDPTTALTYEIIYGGASTPYSTLSFGNGTTGVHLTNDIAYTGSATSTNSSQNTDGTLTIGHLVNSTLLSTVVITLNGAGGTAPGLKDWTYNDVFFIPLYSQNTAFKIDPNSVKVWLINNDGSPITVYGQVHTVVDASFLQQVGVTVRFDNKIRANWDNIRKIGLEYQVTNSSGVAANNKLKIGKPVIGGVDLVTGKPPTSGGYVRFGYSYYYSGQTLESGIAGTVDIPYTALFGIQPPEVAALSNGTLGTHLRITSTVSGDSNVDNNRFYVQSLPDTGETPFVWRRLTTQADSTLYFDVKTNWPEIMALTVGTGSAFKTSEILSATPYKGWVAWGYKGGYQNLRHSAIGEPERQASTNDDVFDDNRGATFSLDDAFADEPLAMFQAGDALIICGKYGIYAQTGNTPSSMSPPKKLPGSLGCAGVLAACRFRSDSGTPGVAFVSRNGEGVFFVSVDESFNAEHGFQIQELTAPIRTGTKSLRAFLLEGQSSLGYTDFSEVELSVDENAQSLWVKLGQRALVFRPPDAASEARGWEPYTYNTGGVGVTIKWLAFSPKRRLRWMRSDGKFDEAEWNYSLAAYITGASRDAGNAIADVYWQTKQFAGDNRRILNARVDRDASSGNITLQCISTRQTASKTITPSARHTRFGPLQQGWRHQFKISMTDAESAVRGLVWEETRTGRRLNS